MTNLNIIGNKNRKSRFDPNLHTKVIKEYELQEIKKRLEEKLDNKNEELEEENTEETAEFHTADISNPQDYIQIPRIKGIHGNPVAISKFEVQGLNNKNYEDTHKAVFQLENGLYIPTPAIFMPHFKNVVSTYKNNLQLLDAEGNPIPRKEHEEIYKHLTTNFKKIYGEDSQAGAWTWLNARFIQGTGFNDLDLETVIGVEQDENLKTKKEPLIPCLNEDGVYTKIEFNPQGLVTTKYKKQEYEQGENLRYWKPEEDRIAWFLASSGGAGLGCYGGPDVSVSALGVFLCAEGTR